MPNMGLSSTCLLLTKYHVSLANKVPVPVQYSFSYIPGTGIGCKKTANLISFLFSREKVDGAKKLFLVTYCMLH